jgi:hypothetical protein
VCDARGGARLWLDVLMCACSLLQSGAVVKSEVLSILVKSGMKRSEKRKVEGKR